MKTIHISLVAVTIVVAGGYYLLADTSKQEKQTTVKTTYQAKMEPVQQNSIQKEKYKESIYNNTPSKTVQKPVYNIRESVHLDDVYEPADIAEMKTKLKTKPKVEPIAAFTMPKGTIRKLYYGDTILLPDIAGHDYDELKIEKRTTGKSGSVILEASVGGDGSIVKSVLTEGERTSYITLNTADGVYELETIDGNGFVYSSADMKNKMIDHSKTDAVIPPHTTHK